MSLRGGVKLPFKTISLTDFVALFVLVTAAFRIDSLGGPDPFPDTVGLGRIAFYHWGPIVGPAEMVRQGGWLLWDVPCQYGLLNTLTLAWTPFQSIWQSFYVVDGVLTAVAAVILYAVLRSTVPGKLGRVFALLLTFAAVFLVTGDPRLNSGPSIGPSLGAYRFFWCFALVAVLAWGFRSGFANPPDRRVLAAGCLAWLAGTFWSCESATYCAAVWLPAFAWIVWDRAAAQVTTAGRAKEAAWILLPPLLLATVVAVTSAYYLAVLGHAPDWRAYFDYSFANITRQAAPMDPAGVVWGPILALLVLTSVAAHLFDRGRAVGAMGLVAGGWGLVWATGSYFVARSDQAIVIYLSPIICLSLALAWLVLERLGLQDRPRTPIRAAFVPMLVVILTLAYGDPVHMPRWSRAFRRVYTGTVDRLLPTMKPELAALMDRAGVGHDDPVCYLDDSFQRNAMPIRPEILPGGRLRRWRERAWTPALPFSLFAPLPGDRGRIYLARFAARSQLSGWLVEPKTPGVGPESLRWFYEGLAETHTPSPTGPVESPLWKVTRYEFKGRLRR